MKDYINKIAAYCMITTAALTFTSVKAEEAKKPKPVLKCIDDLVVNNSEEYRTVINESEEEGVKEMRSLVKSSKLEEAWIYLPKDKKWIEIGKNSKRVPVPKRPGFFKNIVTLDVEQIIELIKNNDDIVDYHFHPEDYSVVETYVDRMKKAGKQVDPDKVAKAKIETAIQQHALPSPEDLLNSAILSRGFYKLNPNGNYTSKVGSLYGVTEFSLTKKGREHYKGKKQDEILKETTNKYNNVILSAAQNKETDPVKRIQKFCSMLSDENVNVSFKAYDK